MGYCSLRLSLTPKDQVVVSGGRLRYARAAKPDEGWWRVSTTREQTPSEGEETTAMVSNLSGLLAMPVQMLSEIEIGLANLVCAEGLPGAENLDVNRALAKLDEMTTRVRSETG